MTGETTHERAVRMARWGEAALVALVAGTTPPPAPEDMTYLDVFGSAVGCIRLMRSMGAFDGGADGEVWTFEILPLDDDAPVNVNEISDLDGRAAVCAGRLYSSVLNEDDAAAFDVFATAGPDVVDRAFALIMQAAAAVIRGHVERNSR